MVGESVTIVICRYIVTPNVNVCTNDGVAEGAAVKLPSKSGLSGRPLILSAKTLTNPSLIVSNPNTSLRGTLGKVHTECIYRLGAPAAKILIFV